MRPGKDDTEENFWEAKEISTSSSDDFKPEKIDEFVWEDESDNHEVHAEKQNENKGETDLDEQINSVVNFGNEVNNIQRETEENNIYTTEDKQSEEMNINKTFDDDVSVANEFDTEDNSHYDVSNESMVINGENMQLEENKLHKEDDSKSLENATLDDEFINDNIKFEINDQDKNNIDLCINDEEKNTRKEEVDDFVNLLNEKNSDRTDDGNFKKYYEDKNNEGNTGSLEQIVDCLEQQILVEKRPHCDDNKSFTTQFNEKSTIASDGCDINNLSKVELNTSDEVDTTLNRDLYREDIQESNDHDHKYQLETQDILDRELEETKITGNESNENEIQLSTDDQKIFLGDDILDDSCESDNNASKSIKLGDSNEIKASPFIKENDEINCYTESNIDQSDYEDKRHVANHANIFDNQNKQLTSEKSIIDETSKDNNLFLTESQIEHNSVKDNNFTSSLELLLSGGEDADYDEVCNRLSSLNCNRSLLNDTDISNEESNLHHNIPDEEHIDIYQEQFSTLEIDEIQCKINADAHDNKDLTDTSIVEDNAFNFCNKISSKNETIDNIISENTLTTDANSQVNLLQDIEDIQLSPANTERPIQDKIDTSEHVIANKEIRIHEKHEKIYTECDVYDNIKKVNIIGTEENNNEIEENTTNISSPLSNCNKNVSIDSSDLYTGNYQLNKNEFVPDVDTNVHNKNRSYETNIFTEEIESIQENLIYTEEESTKQAVIDEVIPNDGNNGNIWSDEDVEDFEKMLCSDTDKIENTSNLLDILTNSKSNDTNNIIIEQKIELDTVPPNQCQDKSVSVVKPLHKYKPNMPTLEAKPMHNYLNDLVDSLHYDLKIEQPEVKKTILIPGYTKPKNVADVKNVAQTKKLPELCSSSTKTIYVRNNKPKFQSDKKSFIYFLNDKVFHNSTFALKTAKTSINNMDNQLINRTMQYKNPDIIIYATKYKYNDHEISIKKLLSLKDDYIKNNVIKKPEFDMSFKSLNQTNKIHYELTVDFLNENIEACVQKSIDNGYWNIALLMSNSDQVLREKTTLQLLEKIANKETIPALLIKFGMHNQALAKLRLFTGDFDKYLYVCLSQFDKDFVEQLIRIISDNNKLDALRAYFIFVKLYKIDIDVNPFYNNIFALEILNALDKIERIKDLDKLRYSHISFILNINRDDAYKYYSKYKGSLRKEYIQKLDEIFADKKWNFGGFRKAVDIGISKIIGVDIESKKNEDITMVNTSVNVKEETVVIQGKNNIINNGKVSYSAKKENNKDELGVTFSNNNVVDNKSQTEELLKSNICHSDNKNNNTTKKPSYGDLLKNNKISLKTNESKNDVKSTFDISDMSYFDVKQPNENVVYNKKVQKNNIVEDLKPTLDTTINITYTDIHEVAEFSPTYSDSSTMTDKMEFTGKSIDNEQTTDNKAITDNKIMIKEKDDAFDKSREANLIQPTTKKHSLYKNERFAQSYADFFNNEHLGEPETKDDTHNILSQFTKDDSDVGKQTKKADEVKTEKPSFFSRFFKSKEKTYKAKIESDASFTYDPVTKQWVNKNSTNKPSFQYVDHKKEKIEPKKSEGFNAKESKSGLSSRYAGMKKSNQSVADFIPGVSKDKKVDN